MLTDPLQPSAALPERSPSGSAWQELLPPMSAHEALVEANRCLYCFDAPCLQACPTHIDIPTFIRKISTENLRGSARVILEANFLGGTCARVCPVQELCEGACVLGADHTPIQIGRLQRYAVDHVQERGVQLFRAGAPTGKSVAVVGSGPAGISAAAELAKAGHAVTLLEKRELAGGLSSYGIISLREPLEVAQREVEALKALGVEVQTGRELVGAVDLDILLAEHDAVFLALGLGAVPAMGIPGEEQLVDGLAFIEQAKLDPLGLQVAQSVVVIGAGNTAIDAATMARRAGAEVQIVYRRTEREMTAYRHEYEFALHEGIGFTFLTQPIEVLSTGGKVTGLRCLKMALAEPDASGRPRPQPVPGSEFVIECGTVIKAIGQEKPALAAALGLELAGGYIKVDDGLETSWPGVYAGGDCIRVRGSASTVMAVQDGKVAAAAISERLFTKQLSVEPAVEKL
ncbi:NAD(P)-dependent oxidoreductase [Deinococcus detaillensis]|uniref:NAD(P)-dependent oxidoreductase n=1 Tax=Deinococcus detaillensis TaxID=2592048 RepID=A0A553V4Y1_9DEIO|nr:NAD(P)-dependent oxidoreductase [Deinococcus detaillensis]TSA87444.1 NAD(P)-dependent oxidoreductase [Deinococcus detaillensis]